MFLMGSGKKRREVIRTVRRRAFFPLAVHPLENPMPLRLAVVMCLLWLPLAGLCQGSLPSFQLSLSAGGFWPRPVRTPWAANGIASHPFGQRVYLATTVEAGGFFDGVWYAGVQGFRHEYGWQYSFRRALSQGLISLGGGPVLGRVIAAQPRWDVTARLSPTLLYSIYQGASNFENGPFPYDGGRPQIEVE